MNTEIVKHDLAPAGSTEAGTWQMMKDQASVMLKSGFLPSTVRTPEQCIAIAMTGKELGIGFMESIRSINVIAGKPTISPQLMLALANRTKQLEDITIESTNDKATITIKRKKRSAHTTEFGVKEATDLGLIGKDNYRKQRKVMFMWRALAANLRVTFPDVVLGMYTPEEMGADVTVAENGDMVHVAAAEAGSVPPKLTPTTGERIDKAVAAFVGKGIPANVVLEYISGLPFDDNEGVISHLTNIWTETKGDKAALDKVFAVAKTTQGDAING